MSKEYISLGTTPIEETCSQVGEENYYQKGIEEGLKFITQLEKEFGQPPQGAKFKLMDCPHDFGNYVDLICEYDPANLEACQYCFNIEINLPEKWEL